jgi:hypothetical protein
VTVPPPLAFEDAVWLLERLSPFEGIVLVGGQAIDYWCERYLDRSKSLEEGAPYTSKDVDLLGTSALVERIARALHGRFWLADPFDATPSAGTIQYRDLAGRDRTLDVLRDLHGLSTREARATAIEVGLAGPRVRFRLRVLHPVLCLESRMKNLVGLPGYDGRHAQAQLRASTVCVLEFARELLEAGPARPCLRLFERVFRLADSPLGDEVLRRTGIEVLTAIAPLPGLPPSFRKTRYPQMKSRIDRRRSR